MKPLSESSLRVTLRWVHIVGGLIIMCYIYSPFSANIVFQYVMKFFILPVLGLTGIWLWQFRKINKLLKIKI